MSLVAILERARARMLAANPCPTCRGLGAFGDVDETTGDVVERWCSCFFGRLRATIENGAPLMIEDPTTPETTPATAAEMPEGAPAAEPDPFPDNADTIRAAAQERGLRLPSRASLAELVPVPFESIFEATRCAVAAARVLASENDGAIAEPAAVLARITPPPAPAPEVEP